MSYHRLLIKASSGESQMQVRDAVPAQRRTTTTTTTPTASPLLQFVSSGHADAYMGTQIIGGPQRLAPPVGPVIGGLVEDATIRQEIVIPCSRGQLMVRHKNVWNAANM